jgi:diguanylate cyclase
MPPAQHIEDSAAAAWDAMRRHAIAPTPRNFEIWYAHCAGDKPGLSARIAAVIAAGQPFTPALLDAFYRDFLATEIDLAALRDGTRDIQLVAREIVDRISRNRAEAMIYGRSLATWAVDLLEAPNIEMLKSATMALARETARAGERSLALEQQLQQSVHRVEVLEQQLASAEDAATTDALTGVANRKHFDAALARAVGEAELQPVSLLMLDIDHFKKFNDGYGHVAGDQVLRLVAKALVAEIKGRDIVARYGGEEFAVILPQTRLEAAAVVAEHIRASLEQRSVVVTRTGRKLGIVTTSVGVAQYQPEEAVIDFIDRADAALYAAKHAGRNRVALSRVVAEPVAADSLS